MTPEERMELAHKQACDRETLLKYVEKLIADAQAAERERCAQIAEAKPGYPDNPSGYSRMAQACDEIAREIRSLSPTNYVERERLKARLDEAKSIRETIAQHTPTLAELAILWALDNRIADLERRLQESQAKETKP
jgi:hypothetical protein